MHQPVQVCDARFDDVLRTVARLGAVATGLVLGVAQVERRVGASSESDRAAHLDA